MYVYTLGNYVWISYKLATITAMYVRTYICTYVCTYMNTDYLCKC